MATSVLVIDDHKMFAELLRTRVDAQPDFEVVGHSTNVADGLALVDQLLPDLVLMHRSDGGIGATAQMTQRRPDARVVILTGYADDLLQRADAANARGLHLQEAGLDRLFWVLRHTGHDGLRVHPEVLHRLVSGGTLLPRRRQPLQPALTVREMEVLRLLATGLDVRSISREKQMSPHTCRGHIKNIFTKLDAHTQLEAVAKAHRQGLLQEWSDQGEGELIAAHAG